MITYDYKLERRWPFWCVQRNFTIHLSDGFTIEHDEDYQWKVFLFRRHADAMIKKWMDKNDTH